MTSNRQHIARLEMRLVLRNRAARYVVVAGPLMITVLGILTLLYPGPSADVVELIYLTSTAAPFTYASVAFSWNGTNWASLFMLPVEPKHQIEGRFLALIQLSAPPTLVLASFAAWLRPEFALFIAAAGCFGVTMVSVPLFLVSAKSAKSLDANAPPFYDTKKFGWQQWVALLVAIAPVYVLLRLVPLEQVVLTIGLMGVMALAALPFMFGLATRVFADTLPTLSDRLLHE